MKHLLTLILLSVFVAQAMAQQTFEDARNVLEDKPAKALKLLGDEQPADPALAYDWRWLRGRSYRALGKSEEAFAEFSKAIALNPAAVDAYLDRADIFYEVMDFSAALADASSAVKAAEGLQHDTMLIAALVMRGSCYMHTGNLKASDDDFNRVLAMDSNNLAALNNLGLNHQERKEYEQAIALLKRMISIDSNFQGGYANLGFIYLVMEKWDDALASYEQALRMSPNDPYALNNIGYVLHKMGRTKEGIASIQEGLKYYKTNSYAYYYLGMIAIDQGNATEACEHLLKAASYGFARVYGNDVDKLREKHCIETK